MVKINVKLGKIMQNDFVLVNFGKRGTGKVSRQKIENLFFLKKITYRSSGGGGKITALCRKNAENYAVNYG